MKRKFSLIALLLFVISIFNGITASATATADEPIVTNVIIHKLQADAYNSTLPLVNNNGEAINPAGLGTNVKGLDGVDFTAVKISGEEFDRYSTGTSPIPAYTEGSGDYIGTTGNGGILEWKVTLTRTAGVVKPEYYAVYETSTPPEVSGFLAVPFVIAFPMTNEGGTAFLSTVNIYPKNITGDLPEVGKDITKLGNKSSSYNIGEEFNYILKGTIPTNIEKYTLYQFKDTLSPYLALTGTASGKAGSVNLVNGSDFTVTQPENSQQVTVSLTPAGIAKISQDIVIGNRGKIASGDIGSATQNTAETPFIEISLGVKMIGTTPLATEITNTATLSYNNGTSGEKTTLATAPVTVVTGGKTFIKVDGTTPLAGAEFTLQEGTERVLWNQELIDANNASLDKFVSPVVGQQIKFKSGDDGTFEIKGLAYSSMGTGGTDASSYYLTETKAPLVNGVQYQLLKDRVAFDVTSESYGSNLQIKNSKRPIIPATGGIGTLIFLVAGSALMFLAYKGYKRQTAK